MSRLSFTFEITFEDTMPTIDRVLLVAETKEELGAANVLSDSRLTTIGESVISKVGDDDTYYPEILCKTIRDSAIRNRSRYALNTDQALKRLESNERVVEWYGADPVSYWDNFLDMLPDLCATLGYCDLSSSSGLGFYGNISPEITVPDCPEYPLGYPLTDSTDFILND